MRLRWLHQSHFQMCLRWLHHSHGRTTLQCRYQSDRWGISTGLVVCASLRATHGTVGGATVTLARVGADMATMSERVDKLRVVLCVRGAQYLLSYMHNSGPSYTLIPSGLCEQLGLAIDHSKKAGSYRIAYGTTSKFACRLLQQVMQLHDNTALQVDNIVVPNN